MATTEGILVGKVSATDLKTAAKLLVEEGQAGVYSAENLVGEEIARQLGDALMGYKFNPGNRTLSYPDRLAEIELLLIFATRNTSQGDVPLLRETFSLYQEDRFLVGQLKTLSRMGNTSHERWRIIVDATLALVECTEEERMEIFGHFCRYCGVNDPRCPCWNDD